MRRWTAPSGCTRCTALLSRLRASCLLSEIGASFRCAGLIIGSGACLFKFEPAQVRCFHVDSCGAGSPIQSTYVLLTHQWIPSSPSSPPTQSPRQHLSLPPRRHRWRKATQGRQHFCHGFPCEQRRYLSYTATSHRHCRKGGIKSYLSHLHTVCHTCMHAHTRSLTRTAPNSSA